MKQSLRDVYRQQQDLHAAEGYTYRSPSRREQDAKEAATMAAALCSMHKWTTFMDGVKTKSSRVYRKDEVERNGGVGVVAHTDTLQDTLDFTTRKKNATIRPQSAKQPVLTSSCGAPRPPSSSANMNASKRPSTAKAGQPSAKRSLATTSRPASAGVSIKPEENHRTNDTKAILIQAEDDDPLLNSMLVAGAGSTVVAVESPRIRTFDVYPMSSAATTTTLDAVGSWKARGAGGASASSTLLRDQSDEPASAAAMPRPPSAEVIGNGSIVRNHFTTPRPPTARSSSKTGVKKSSQGGVHSPRENTPSTEGDQSAATRLQEFRKQLKKPPPPIRKRLRTTLPRHRWNFTRDDADPRLQLAMGIINPSRKSTTDMQHKGSGEGGEEKEAVALTSTAAGAKKTEEEERILIARRKNKAVFGVPQQVPVPKKVLSEAEVRAIAAAKAAEERAAAQKAAKELENQENAKILEESENMDALVRREFKKFTSTRSTMGAEAKTSTPGTAATLTAKAPSASTTSFDNYKTTVLLATVKAEAISEITKTFDGGQREESAVASQLWKVKRREATHNEMLRQRERSRVVKYVLDKTAAGDYTAEEEELRRKAKEEKEKLEAAKRSKILSMAKIQAKLAIEKGWSLDVGSTSFVKKNARRKTVAGEGGVGEEGHGFMGSNETITDF